MSKREGSTSSNSAPSKESKPPSTTQNNLRSSPTVPQQKAERSTLPPEGLTNSSSLSDPTTSKNDDSKSTSSRQKITAERLKRHWLKAYDMWDRLLLDAWLKFRLLMWKNLLQQWRRPMQTAAELILPIITMSLMLLIRWKIPPKNMPPLSYPRLNAYTLHFSLHIAAEMDKPLKIAYSPRSPILEEILVSAMTNMYVENSYILLNDLKPSVIAYNNSKALSGLYEKEKTTREVLAAVEFDDRLQGATEIPKDKLSYSLRFPERPRLNAFFRDGARDWKTDIVFVPFDVPGPRWPHSWTGGNQPGYVNEIFTALQQAVSVALISKMTGEDIRKSFKVYFHRLPHPPYWEDHSLNLLKILFPLSVMLSCSYTAINIVRAIVVEKELQLKETMKIMGLPTWLHWTAWFCKQFIFQFLVAIIITILLKVHWFTSEEGYDDYSAFTHTPWTVLLFFLLLYLCCMIFFCFMLSGFFSKGSSAALFTGVIWFLSFMPVYLLTTDIELSVSAQIFSCLIINTAMAYGFQLLLANECIGGLQWGEFMSTPDTESSRFMFGHVVMMLIFNCILYMLITLYFEQVAPGPYGTPRHWSFPFKSEFWCPNRKSGTKMRITDGITKKINEITPPRLRVLFSPVVRAYRSAFDNNQRPTVRHDITNYNIVQEKDPENHTIGVKMQNLTKMYGDQTVVNNLNLNIYNDQITVLLGHNGAGKTTTLSMLTGYVKPTYGTVNVDGYDMRTQAADARSHIGVCPQHDVLFDELTVREHLEFFSRLKGLTGIALKTDIDTLIKKLELDAKRDYQSKGLSGGQKRRLCVGIALSGKANVVLLDEPTSGMDPASRRGLWELLQKEKKGRSMILTTHFMDEADILGDRVAIMAQGRLQCLGSPFFLKQYYGVGYILVIVKDVGFDTERCTALINNHIPGTVVKEDRGSEVTYSLPNDFSSKFENMLNDLESNVEAIKFKNYGLVTTTLEDVFMTIGADLTPVKTNQNPDEEKHSATTRTTNEIDLALEKLDKPESSVKGYDLHRQRVLAVWLKLALVWQRSWWVVLLQFITPIILLNVSLGVLEYIMSLEPVNKKRKLTLTTGYERTESLLSFNGTSDLTLKAAEAYKKIFESSKVGGMKLTSIGNADMSEYYLKRTKDPAVMRSLRRLILIGATFEDGSATAWFSNYGCHDVPTTLAAVHLALLKTFNPDSDLTVYNHPLKANYADQTDMQTMITMMAMQLTTGLGSSVAVMTAVYIMFYIKERVSGAKLLQKTAGLQPIVMWGSAAVFDWVWFFILTLPILISCIIFDVAGLSDASGLARLLLCLMLYAAAAIPLTYLLSHVFNGPALGFVGYFFFNVLLGMLGSQVVDGLMAPQLPTRSTAEFMDSILQYHPLYCLISAVRYLNKIGLHEKRCLQKCDYYRNIYPDFKCNMKELCKQDDSCCNLGGTQFNWEEPGILRYLVFMVIMCVVLWILLMVVEYGLLKQIWTRKKQPPPLDKSTLDSDVAAEAEHAHNVYKSDRASQALLAKDLSKYYGKYLAVNQVSFCVNDRECFGLLGVNGAGKTSTFKMLMGDETISSGEAYISGYSVEKKLYKVHENIGYCPQFDALFMELTGRETLRVFTLMRGLRDTSVSYIDEAFAHALGFHRHLDKRVHQCSGGTKRKLNTAVAFLGKTRLAFVDEPTTGVDPAAKRHVWQTVRGVQRAGRGVVLTSHSMEECEALCSRLTIMVNGGFQCLGTPQHLKNKFSQGFTLIIKLKVNENEEFRLASTAQIKEYVNSNFSSPRLMEEYQDLLTYYLPDRSIPWSRLFGIMERAKQELDVEDYSITQTTLEQIFLQFTKYQGLEQDAIKEKTSNSPQKSSTLGQQDIRDPAQNVSTRTQDNDPGQKVFNRTKDLKDPARNGSTRAQDRDPAQEITNRTKDIRDPAQNSLSHSQDRDPAQEITNRTEDIRDPAQNDSTRAQDRDPAQETTNRTEDIKDSAQNGSTHTKDRDPTQEITNLTEDIKDSAQNGSTLTKDRDPAKEVTEDIRDSAQNDSTRAQYRDPPQEITNGSQNGSAHIQNRDPVQEITNRTEDVSDSAQNDSTRAQDRNPAQEITNLSEDIKDSAQNSSTHTKDRDPAQEITNLTEDIKDSAQNGSTHTQDRDPAKEITEDIRDSVQNGSTRAQDRDPGQEITNRTEDIRDPAQGSSDPQNPLNPTQKPGNSSNQKPKDTKKQ